MAWFVFWISTFTSADILIFVVAMLIFLVPITAWAVWTMTRHDSFVDRLADVIGGRHLSFFSNPNLVTGSVDGIPCACHYAIESRGGPNILRIKLKMQFARRAVFEAGSPPSELPDGLSDASDRVIEVVVSTLRNKLDKAGLPAVIETRRGFGYRVP